MNGLNDRVEKWAEGEFYSIINFYDTEDSKCPKMECSKSYFVID